jgi:alpha-beta hydrolase superfamily lysophospholipase
MKNPQNPKGRDVAALQVPRLTTKARKTRVTSRKSQRKVENAKAAQVLTHQPTEKENTGNRLKVVY